MDRDRTAPRGRARIAALALLVAGCGAQAPAPSDEAAPPDAPPSSRAVTLELDADPSRIEADLSALAEIASANDGIRTSGTPGYEASVDHAVAALRDAGWQVETPEVEFIGFRDTGAELRVGAETFTGPDEVRALIYSPGGEVRAPAAVLAGSGCDADDFDGIGAGDIAVTTRGGCLRRDQVTNAVEAGVGALVVGYPDRGPGEIFRPTLIDPAGMDIPVVSVTDEAVEALAASDGDVIDLSVSTEREPGTFRNVIAQLGDGPSVVMLGAHLDSVLDGPGINDNGSGVAALLEIARGAAATGVPDGWALRIGLWGAEEFGTIGSGAYVAESSEDVVAYLNLDMAGSVNGATLVYDDGSAPAGSADISQAFRAWFEARGEPSETVDLGGSSDHAPFARAGIPTGGLFAGASESGSAAAPGSPGGGAPDPCYHIACDDLDNVDVERVTLFAEATFAVAFGLMSGR